jgi:PAS domain S-box-containing protein
MPSETPDKQTPTSGRDEDSVASMVGTTPRPLPGHEDVPTQCEEQVTRSPDGARQVEAAFEHAAVGLALVSQQGRCLHFNPRVCELTGYSLEEFTARNFWDLAHPDDRDAARAHVQSLLTGEQDAYDSEERWVRKDRVLVWVHLSASLMRTADGAPDYCTVTVQDVTGYKAMQALTDTALSHLTLDDLLRELLARAVDVMSVDHVAILVLDEDSQTLTMRAARGAGEAYIGRIQVTMGQGFAGRIAASREPLIVDDLAASDVGLPVFWKRLRSVVGVPLIAADRVNGHPENRLVGVINVGSVAARHFTEADVQLLQRAADRIALAIDRALLYAAEQNARQQAEAAVSRALVSETQATDRAQRLQTILETMTDGVAMYDAEGRPVQVNRAYRELYALERGPAGFESLSALDRARLLHLRDAVTGAPLPLERVPIARALRGEVVTGPEADMLLRAFDGRELVVNASAVPMREPDGRIIGIVSVLRDLTERKRLEREHEAARTDELAARETSRRMEQFLAVAAHDLRSPLSAAMGFIELAERQAERQVAAAQEKSPALAAGAEAVRDRIVDADQSAERLTRLLTRLFDMAAIRADRLELRRAPCDLVALVREQVDALRVAAPGRTITLHTPADEKPIPVEVDADRIDQVIANYVTNALKYSPADRPVDVYVVARGSRARVAVRDAGPGIPKEERGRVWELFHRTAGVEAQGRTQGGSLGLGLHICKAIIQAHNGRVGVKSEVGHGSTFWFTLPLAQATAR